MLSCARAARSSLAVASQLGCAISASRMAANPIWRSASKLNASHAVADPPDVCDGKTALVNQNILETAMFLHEYSGDGRQFSLNLDVARLSEGFFNQLMKHPVPVAEAAIKSLQNNSTALDIYCWLAYRLHVFEEADPDHMGGFASAIREPTTLRSGNSSSSFWMR